MGNYFLVSLLFIAKLILFFAVCRVIGYLIVPDTTYDEIQNVKKERYNKKKADFARKKYLKSH
jgi:hypothetical protein